MRRCKCGHAEDEHAKVGTRACTVDGCDCPSFVDDPSGELEPKLRIEGTEKGSTELPDDVA